MDSINKVSKEGEIKRHEAEIIASTLVRQAKKGIKVDQTLVENLKENLFEFFQVNRKIHKITLKNSLEVVSTKTENKRYLNKMKRFERRRQMGLPQKMLGDTLEFGERLVKKSQEKESARKIEQVST